MYCDNLINIMSTKETSVLKVSEDIFYYDKYNDLGNLKGFQILASEA